MEVGQVMDLVVEEEAMVEVVEEVMVEVVVVVEEEKAREVPW